jgi:hypothetical protein
MADGVALATSCSNFNAASEASWRPRAANAALVDAQRCDALLAMGARKDFEIAGVRSAGCHRGRLRRGRRG